MLVLPTKGLGQPLPGDQPVSLYGVAYPSDVVRRSGSWRGRELDVPDHLGTY